jgi:hypothetical protein
VFDVDDEGYGRIGLPSVPDELRGDAERGARACPVAAITVKEQWPPPESRDATSGSAGELPVSGDLDGPSGYVCAAHEAPTIVCPLHDVVVIASVEMVVADEEAFVVTLTMPSGSSSSIRTFSAWCPSFSPPAAAPGGSIDDPPDSIYGLHAKVASHTLAHLTGSR